jgi:proton-translocating NAD(P)+ transhydrogenase subunit beta
MAPPIAGFDFQDPNFITACYIVAFSLFIFGVRQGTHPTTARRGNMIAAAGMAIAIAATLIQDEIGNWGLIVLGLAIGTAVGVPAARNVKMTAMPQMVALFNGVGGGAAALIAWSEFRHATDVGSGLPLETFIPILFSMVIGSVSFWGSNIAFGKLQELISGRPILVPGQQILNGLILAAILVGCVVLAVNAEDNPSQGIFIGVLILAAVLGNLFVLPIGGADMPVVISMLNAFTGLAAAAAGFALDNVALIVAGTLVGSSGTILTMEMSRAMNRSIANILFAGFGAVKAGAGPGEAEDRPVRSTSAADAAIQLSYASQVVVVPGYGMAVAQAQHAVREMAEELEKRGVEVKYAIHPVAGRMPGHMNVLLAEADVPYEQLKEMDDINPEFPRTDVALVIGANDVTNPAANTNPDSPIYGMPILNVNEAQSVIVLKRSMNPGFAGIENELYYDEKTAMLFGDAKESVGEITQEVGEL